MKKPFKLDAYYLVDCSGISQNSATERAGLDTENQVVFYVDPKLYYVDDDNDLMVNGSGCGCLMTNGERLAYAKRCDNKFIVGVKYRCDSIDDKSVYICQRNEDGIKQLSNGVIYIYCWDASPCDYTPVVGEL